MKEQNRTQNNAAISGVFPDLGGLPAESRPGWWTRTAERIVRAALADMRAGELRMVLPDGRVLSFGTGTDGPAAVMRVRDWRFFGRCALDGDIGFGESYQAGEWDTEDLAGVIGWFCANEENAPSMSGSRVNRWHFGLFNLGNRLRHLLRKNTIRGSRANIHAHYDLGNEFYGLWLDSTMTYSSALFEHPDQALDAAQTAKYERLCRMLKMGPSDRVLEIGGGWGGFASHAVRHHGCRVTAVTISSEQHRYASERFAREGIADRAEVVLLDYRKVPEMGRDFDKIASIEMLEAVGDEYLGEFFRICRGVLSPRGLIGAQFITCPDARHRELRRGVDWIQKHVFPGSLLLSLDRTNRVVEQATGMRLDDVVDFGADYARTLRMWRGRFNAGIATVRSMGFDDRFVRTWNYYLAYCEAAFAWKCIGVVQAVWTGASNPMPA